ncbi:MAG: MFS transporter [Pirellulales bacterium]|nr:MFS transporter [Pirellulales bacterium]
MSSPENSPLSDARPNPPSIPATHPRGFYFFFWGEFAERCTYYGVKTILLLYMIDVLRFERGNASSILSYFMAACFFLPLLGGYIADNFLGKYRTIVYFSIPYIIAQIIIGFENVYCLFFALVLIAMGSGVTKPNISTLMGMTYDQQRPGQTQLRSTAFAAFYVAINTGSFLSSLFMPIIRDNWGYRIAFLFPIVLMSIALFLFAVGKPYYAVEKIERVRLTPEERRQRRIVLRRLFGLFLLVVFFWTVMEQYTTIWTLFARDHLNLNMFDYAEGTWQWNALVTLRDTFNINLIGKQVAADQFQFLNGLLIIILVPSIAVIWNRLARFGVKLRPTDKMFIGFILTIITPIILSIAGFRSAEVGRVSTLWLIVPYIVITAAEVCISVVGLELAFSAAPQSMKSFVTGCWLMTIAGGQFIIGQLAPYYEKTVVLFGQSITFSPGVYFGCFAVAMVFVTLAFVIVARRFNRSLESVPHPA